MATTYSQSIGSSAYVLPVMDYDDLPTSSQALLWHVLRYASNVGGGSASQRLVNVLDKMPEPMNASTSYPILIVHMAKISEEHVAWTRKRVELDFQCQLIARQVHVQRQMLSNIRNAIRSNLALFGRFRLEKAVVDSDWEEYPLPDGKMAYKSMVNIRFEAVLDYISGT